MRDPLSSDVVAKLRSDPTAALAAALILAGSFPDLVSWAMKAFGGKDCAKANGAKGQRRGREQWRRQERRGKKVSRQRAPQPA